MASVDPDLYFVNINKQHDAKPVSYLHRFEQRLTNDNIQGGYGELGSQATFHVKKGEHEMAEFRHDESSINKEESIFFNQGAALAHLTTPKIIH
jgi:hypothetical protein